MKVQHSGRDPGSARSRSSRALRAARQWLLVMGCVGILVGCGSQPPKPATPTSPPTASGGNWFCQMNAAGTGWECVQDAELAERPRPDRLPERGDLRRQSGQPPADPFPDTVQAR